MKKRTTIIIILLALAHITIAQGTLLTSYRHDLSVAKDDTTRVSAMLNLIYYYASRRPDSSLAYGYKALELARKIKFLNGEFGALESLIVLQGFLGNSTRQLQLIFQAEKIITKDMQQEKAILIQNRG